MTGEQGQTRARVNVGCGMTPTPGWHNLDNSLSVRLAAYPRLTSLGTKVGVISAPQARFVAEASAAGIRQADVRKPMPFPADSLDVVYSSHMLEHLDRSTAAIFIEDAHRVLRPGGVIRIAVPDLQSRLDHYRETGDADQFMESLHMDMNLPTNWREGLRSRMVSFRGHRWMYDADSLARLLRGGGFVDEVALSAGETTIPEPGELDLHERADESLYMEARKP